MLGRAAYVIFPTASGMTARNDEEGIRRLYRRTSRLFFSVNGSVTMAMCASAYPLLKYWVSPTYAEEGALALVVFALTSAVNASTMSASHLNLAAARPGVNLMFAFSNSAVSLATVYPLTVRWGVTGAALAGLLGAMNVPVFFWHVHKHIIGTSSWSVWRECYQPTVLANVPIGVGLYFLLTSVVSSLFQALVGFAAAVLLGMVGSGLLGAIKREDLRALWEVAKGFWPKRRRPPSTDGGADDAA
jgi:O-antigen/teichoic acid export membrane protein